MPYCTPTEAARITRTSASTIRSWCKTYAAYLSPDANPSFGQERRFNAADMNVLKQIAALRNDGCDSITIHQRLSGKEPATALAEAPQPFPVADGLTQRIDDLQQQIDALSQRSMWVFASGAIVGAMCAVVAAAVMGTP